MSTTTIDRVRLTLAVLSGLWVGGFIVAGAFARDLMATKAIGPISWGWGWAMTIPVFVLVVTTIHGVVEAPGAEADR